MITETNKFSLKFLYPKFWPLWLCLGLAKILVMLPFSWQMKIGAGLGNLVRFFAKGRVKIAKRNLEICFPDKSEAEINTIIVNNFKEVGRAIFDIINAWWWSNTRVQKHMNVNGVENIAASFSKQRGIILLAVHCLPLEMGARVCEQYFPGVGVYKPHKNPLFEYIQVKGRLRTNKGLIQRRNVKQMIKALRSLDIIWYTAESRCWRS